MTDTPRVVLVETSDVAPGLLPFQAWDAIATAPVVYVRDRDGHPSVPHLYFAGVDIEQLEPIALERAEMNLMEMGSADDRRMSKALFTRAIEHGRAVYLLGPGDDALAKIVGTESVKYGGETEFVFLAQRPRGAELLRLVEVMARLRDPVDGCPWDLEQDHASLAPHLIEESYELLEAIDAGHDVDIAEELGDVLLQVVFHAQVARDRKAFGIDDVARGIADKLVRRHPHVFADGDASTADEVQQNWDQIKQAEKGRDGVFDGVPNALPALMLLQKLQSRAAKAGIAEGDLDSSVGEVRAALDELVAATQDDDGDEDRDDAMGRAVAALVAVARSLDVDVEQAARRRAEIYRRDAATPA